MKLSTKSLRKSMFAIVGASFLALGAAGCTHSGPHRGEAHAASPEKRAKMLERVSSQLNLNEDQKKKLSVLSDRMQEQRTAMAGRSGDPRSEFKSVISGTTLDRAKAQAMVDERAASVRSKSPELITAAGDFYDSLNPEQQQKVRDFMDRRRGGHRRS